MASTPGNRRIQIPNGLNTLTADSYADKSVLGVERRYTMVEVFELTSTGTVASAVIPPTGSRLAITGISVSWLDQLQADVELAVEVTLAGSGILGTADMSLGTFVPAMAAVPLEVGNISGILPAVHPPEFCLVTSEGNGVNHVYRVNVAKLTTPDEAQVAVYYAPIYAADLGC